jgi:hypothetical protein
VNTIDEYYRWLLKFVYDDKCPKYDVLLERLFETPFVALIERADDRIKDVLRLRWQYADENGIERSIVANDINGPCSMLELMIALAIRCESDIMANDSAGDRSGQWFWQMVASLGIGVLTDDVYNKSKYADDYFLSIIDTFLKRQYEYNGQGSLFTIDNPKKDMRLLSIWEQMNLFIGEGY